MQYVRLAFPNLSNMAWFILRIHLSNFTADWQNASLTSEMESSLISTACDTYGATILEMRTVKMETTAGR